jgi:hypothetical protein
MQEEDEERNQPVKRREDKAGGERRRGREAEAKGEQRGDEVAYMAVLCVFANGDTGGGGRARQRSVKYARDGMEGQEKAWHGMVQYGIGWDGMPWHYMASHR